MLNNPLAKALALATIITPATVLAETATIDLLIVHTKGVTDLYNGDPSSRFNHLVETTNQIYADSGVDLQLNIAHTVEVNYSESTNSQNALNDITNGNGAFSTIAGLREVHEADMVVLFRPYNDNHGSCGLAWVGGVNTNADFSAQHIKNYQYSHVAVNSCGDYVTAHELGHNLGLRHSRKQDGSGGTTAYALGHGVNGKFTTVMAYQSEFNVDYWTGKVYKFSNPDITCKGLPCGVDRNQSQGADARFALNITGPQVANYFGDPNATVTSELQIAYNQMLDAQTDYNDAIAALAASDTAYDTKKAAEKAAKDAIKPLKKTAKDTAKAYAKLLKDQAKASKKATQAQAKAATQLDKYNNASSDKAANTAYGKYETYTNDYNTYTAQANSLLSQAQSMEPDVTAATAALTEATTDYETAKQATADEKDQNKLLKKDVSNKKKIFTTLEKQYNKLLKSWS